MDRKLDAAVGTGARVLVTDDQGCIMHFRDGVNAGKRPIRVVHIAELLAERIHKVTRLMTVGIKTRLRRGYASVASFRPDSRPWRTSCPFEELGREPRRSLTPEAKESWRGISVFDTIENAEAHVGRSAHLGTYAAVMEIGPEQRVEAKRTGGTRGHWTLWGSADEMLSCVTAIIDISAEQEGT